MAMLVFAVHFFPSGMKKTWIYWIYLKLFIGSSLRLIGHNSQRLNHSFVTRKKKRIKRHKKAMPVWRNWCPKIKSSRLLNYMLHFHLYFLSSLLLKEEKSLFYKKPCLGYSQSPQNSKDIDRQTNTLTHTNLWYCIGSDVWPVNVWTNHCAPSSFKVPPVEREPQQQELKRFL